jgi:hypothetical protein
MFTSLQTKPASTTPPHPRANIDNRHYCYSRIHNLTHYPSIPSQHIPTLCQYRRRASQHRREASQHHQANRYHQVNESKRALRVVDRLSAATSSRCHSHHHCTHHESSYRVLPSKLRAMKSTRGTHRHHHRSLRQTILVKPNQPNRRRAPRDRKPLALPSRHPEQKPLPDYQRRVLSWTGSMCIPIACSRS